MHVGRHEGRIVERAHPQETLVFAEVVDQVVAPQRDLALRAARNALPTSAGRVSRKFLDLAGQENDAIGFDERVDRVGAAGLPLTIVAVARVHNHRFGGHAVAHRATGATAFAKGGIMRHWVLHHC